jgi:hypothetical protein
MLRAVGIDVDRRNRRWIKRRRLLIHNGEGERTRAYIVATHSQHNTKTPTFCFSAQTCIANSVVDAARDISGAQLKAIVGVEHIVIVCIVRACNTRREIAVAVVAGRWVDGDRLRACARFREALHGHWTRHGWRLVVDHFNGKRTSIVGKISYCNRLSDTNNNSNNMVVEPGLLEESGEAKQVTVVSPNGNT